jgi:hypothetical protein
MSGRQPKQVENVRRACVNQEENLYCTRCKLTKSKDFFYYRNLHKEARCKECVSFLRKETYKKNPGKYAAKQAEYRRNNPEKVAAVKRKQAFGITAEQYDALLIAQNNSCAICTTHQSELKFRLAVDHCHATGRIRGLLCPHCNVALGHLKEDVNLMNAMIQYTLKHKKQG